MAGELSQIARLFLSKRQPASNRPALAETPSARPPFARSVRRVTPNGMAWWLGHVCREARRHGDLRLRDIADAVGVEQSVISRFETQPGWRRDTDLIVSAYERELGLGPGTLWRRAVEAWAADTGP